MTRHVIARENGYDNWPQLVADTMDREQLDREGRFVNDELHGVPCEYLQEIFQRTGHTDFFVGLEFRQIDEHVGVDVALRRCYPFRTRAPIRETLARFGRRPEHLS